MPPPDASSADEDDVGSPSNPLKFLDQDYQTLSQKYLSRRIKYIDELFPPGDTSIGKELLSKLNVAQIRWRRPCELVKDPEFILDGVSRFDYAQGSKLGNCWFLAAIGALSSQKDVMKQVIPAEQTFSGNYAGIFHFRFWRFGRWIDVVIDDKLPTIDDELIFVHSKTSNEFWPALLEKAYAKVCGSYADLESGFISEALMDFTGGVHLHFEMTDAPADLWNMMDCAFRSETLMGCSSPQGATPENTVLPNGVVEGHSYTVMGVSQVMSKGRAVRLVRVFNPWGYGEWTGAWSDESSLWDSLSEEERTRCLSVAEDGEFWMSWTDFIKSFEAVDICCLSPHFLDGSSECNWTSKHHFGRWVTGKTAGGSRGNMKTFWTNPQFRVRIEELDEDRGRGQRAENILVSLMQNHEKRHRKQLPNYIIGFYVFKIPPEMKGDGGKFTEEFFYRTYPVAKTEIFTNLREVMKIFRLNPGEYLIVPCTLSPNESASFLLSVFSKH